jgi:hypothetical protein
MADHDFSVRSVTNDQAEADDGRFEHPTSTDWLSYSVLIINVIGFLIFATYFFTHRYHHSIQKTLNESTRK